MGSVTISLLVLAAVTVAAIVLYNKLIALRNRWRNAYSQIDVQLQRRYELIPNLVETARAYMEHERETLTAVTEARNGAEQQRQSTKAATEGSVPGTSAADSVTALAAAEQQVAGALGRFNLVMEAYPELKADERLADLHADLASTENRVSFARQAYSDAVMRYNIGIEQFPTLIVARLFRFDEAALFEATDPQVREAVQVSFA